MWRSMLKTASATIAFGLIHSALASRTARRAAERALGPRDFDGLYRTAYNAQAVATSAALAAYVRRLPDRELYHVRGPLGLLMRAGQVAGLAHAAWAVQQIGFGRLTGWDSLSSWLAGAEEVPPAAVGQGPSLGPDGTLRADGPFRYSRHPLNLSPLPILWLQPRMTANLLAFNLAATAYFILGSAHAESRQRAAFGRAYAEYRRSGVPFYIPRLAPGPRAGRTPSAPAVPPRDAATLTA